MTSWAEEWDEVRPRRPRDPDAEARRREEEREANRENRAAEFRRERDEHYWSRPVEVGFRRYTPRSPLRPQGVIPIEKAIASVPRADPRDGLLVCGPCRGGRHGDCSGVFRLGDEDVLCECSDSAHWIRGGGR